ncbi:MAG TPA: hypothetical protein V6D47_01005, partial [Oscillatoriaceae cyanobacterium]
LNEIVMDAVEAARPRLLEVVPPVAEPGQVAAPGITRFRVLPGGGRTAEEADPRVAHALERLRDGLAGVLSDIEDLMGEQLAEAPEANGGKKSKEAEYATGFRHGMLEALETAYALLQSELLMSEPI